MSHQIRRHKLRKKSGCLCCRRRRKACDETTPICGRCSLSGRACEWPDVTQLVDRRYTSHPNSRYSGTSDVSLVCLRSTNTAHAQLTTDLEVVISRHFIEKYYEFLVLPNCHPAFRDGWIRDIQELMTEDESLRYSVLANAASHIHNMDTNPGMQSLALNYYSKSIRGLSKVLTQASDPYLTSCNGFLSSVILLYLLGCMGKGTYFDVPPHVHAAMRVITLRLFRTSSIELQPFDCLALESVLYQIFLASTVLWSDEASLIEFDLDFWLKAESLLQTSVMFPGKPNSLNSPVLGVPAALFRLAIQVQQACRSPAMYDFEARQSLRREVETWEGIVLANRMIGCTADHNPATRQQTYYEGASYLYVLIVSLLLDQISESPECDSPSGRQSSRLPEPVPRWQVETAIRIIRSFENDTGWSGCYIGNWPVYTLGFFLSAEEDIDLIRNEMSRRWTSASFMQVSRFHADLEAVWSARKHSLTCT
ncbi:hypothetical protein CC86DRAFT_291830 [Ophiobolus disseminans]|uniref:Zn(2)-C6 fungal-type domain-containing protein n=1 Tax=Ophiobolus disseminans TaxID=1469910 RepID=A0A6A7A117_9PLEO|nr:hypothetical protein CC86DRAFT_291830 [Ophiobolus disseminans]